MFAGLQGNVENNKNELSGIVFKAGDSCLPSNYRPLTVPSNILRLITVRMCKHMTEAVEANGILGPEQFGFRRGRSTLDAIFVLSTLLRKARGKR